MDEWEDERQIQEQEELVVRLEGDTAVNTDVGFRGSLAEVFAFGLAELTQQWERIAEGWLYEVMLAHNDSY